MRRTLAAFAVLALVLTGCTVPGASSAPTDAPSPAPASSEPPAAAAGRLADLDEVVAELAAHPEPYIGGDEASFTARVDAVRDQVDTMSDTAFLMAVMGLTARRDQDGHTGTFAMAQQNGWLTAWPIWLWEFPDGWRIVAAREPYTDLIGARVVSIGETEPEDVAAAVEPLVPRDNDSSLRANLPLLLTIPEILDELDVLEPGTAALTVETPDGETHAITPEGLPIIDFRAWITEAYGGRFPVALPPDEDGPAVLRNRDRELWTEPLDGGGLYVGYNNVVRVAEDGTTIGAIAERVDEAAAAAEPVVIDLRNNPGGDNGTFVELRQAVEDFAAEHPGRIAVLTGRGTFSAAGNFVTDLETGAFADAITLVGEPPGGGLNVWGNVRIVTLPWSEIRVIIATKPEFRAPDDPRTAIPVDVPAEATWDDIVAGRDPVLDAALAAIAGASAAD